MQQIIISIVLKVFKELKLPNHKLFLKNLIKY